MTNSGPYAEKLEQNNGAQVYATRAPHYKMSTYASGQLPQSRAESLVMVHVTESEQETT